jgi:TPR repeat protein
MRRILTGLVLILMLTSAASAGPYDDGFGASQRGDWATALRLWRPLAEQGHASAQMLVGGIYDDGKGVVPQDYAEAMKWYRLSAEQGDSGGQILLGVMYYDGKGVPKALCAGGEVVSPLRRAGR